MAGKDNTLVIITPGFPENEEDVGCLPAQQIFVRTLNKNFPSLNVVILTIQYPFRKTEYKWYGNDVTSFSAKKGKRHKLYIWWQLWQQLNKLKKEYNVIGILSFWLSEYAMLGKYFAKKNKIRQYTWLLGQDAKPGNKFASMMRAKPGEILALSDMIREEFNKNYGVKAKNVIPIGLDTTMYGKGAIARDIDVLGTGSLIPLKQYDIFIDVVKELQQKLPGIRSIIWGTGPEEEKLKRKVADLQLQDNLTMPCKIAPHEDVLRLMQRAKIFLHTSSYEGFGTVCLEALYAGAHVISFYQPMNEAIKNWHVVSSKNEMTQKALEILQNEKTTYEPVAVYSMDDTAHAIMKLYGL